MRSRSADVHAGARRPGRRGDQGRTPRPRDDTRDWGLPVGTRNTAYFNSANRNKQSIGIDLQKPDGQRIVRELAAKCDVLVQNFKFGGIDKMGPGYETLKAINPCQVATPRAISPCGESAYRTR